MGFFRRESLHERLAREGGLDERPPHDTTPRWGEAGIHGVSRPRQWDAVATTEAPGLFGDEIQFVGLPDGSILVEDDASAEALTPLADALEGVLKPPYRAQAVRRGGDTWAIGGRSIEVTALPEEVEGDELVLSVAHGERTLLVDGLPGFGSVLELERLGAARYESYVARAERLDERLWEVNISPL